MRFRKLTHFSAKSILIERRSQPSVSSTATPRIRMKSNGRFDRFYCGAGLNHCKPRLMNVGAQKNSTLRIDCPLRQA